MAKITFETADGKEQTFLRKDVERIKAMSISFMPEDLAKTLAPQDIADVIAWIRTPPAEK